MRADDEAGAEAEAMAAVDTADAVDDTARPASGFTRHRWLLPSAVVAGLDPDTERPGRPHRRTARDRVVDFCCFLLAVAVGRGLSNADIAADLFMSVATVKAHVSRILAKLDLNNRVQIALLAYDAGLLEDGTGDGH
ncbi:response regulator transcription factor [Streptomyces sp. NBC_01485]|uniref:response regulator transcription factor n=1 Tax=Streptomyces sp. NBC_01485 TaxID=2903884 RepID=UPI003FCC44CE